MILTREQELSHLKQTADAMKRFSEEAADKVIARHRAYYNYDEGPRREILISEIWTAMAQARDFHPI